MSVYFTHCIISQPATNSFYYYPVNLVAQTNQETVPPADIQSNSSLTLQSAENNAPLINKSESRPDQKRFISLLEDISILLNHKNLRLRNCFADSGILDDLHLYTYLWESLAEVDMTNLLLKLIPSSLAEAVLLLSFHPCYQKDHTMAVLYQTLLDCYRLAPTIAPFYLGWLIKEHLIDFSLPEAEPIEAKLFSNYPHKSFYELLSFIVGTPVKDLLLSDFLKCNIDWRSKKVFHITPDALKDFGFLAHFEKTTQSKMQLNLSIAGMDKGCLKDYIRHHHFNEVDAAKLYKDYIDSFKETQAALVPLHHN